MSFFNLIASLEKERTEKMITYYYEIDSIRFSKKTSGIFSIDLELFNDSIDSFNDYIGSAMLYNLDHHIELIRASKNSFPLKDCVDLYGIIAASLILRHYHETKEIPNKYYFIPADIYQNEWSLL